MAEPKEATTPVRLLVDYWAEEDVRTPAGEVIEVPMSVAMDLLSEGKAQRADKFGK